MNFFIAFLISSVESFLMFLDTNFNLNTIIKEIITSIINKVIKIMDIIKIVFSDNLLMLVIKLASVHKSMQKDL